MMGAPTTRSFVLLALFALVSCRTPKETSTTPQTGPKVAAPVRAPDTFSLQVLLTADEHGWLNPLHDKKAGVLLGGVHAFAGALRADGYTKDGPGWLLLSAGDMWTGPYETTVLEGAPMTAAMSHLGYRAAAIGNHEFDFGQRAVDARSRSSTFPFVAANLVKSGTLEHPPWMKPYTMVDVPVHGATGGGMARVAVVGLACVDSPITADVRNLVGLEFLPYAQTLERVLPEVKTKEKPDAIVVVTHDSLSATTPLTPILRKHGVHLMAAGHEHRQGIFVDDNGTNDRGDDVVVCNAGPYLRSFCRVDLELKRGSGAGHALTSHTEKIVDVRHPQDAPAPPFDAELATIVEQAEASATRIGGEVLATVGHRLTRGRDGTLGPLIVDAWLEALPYAQVAITNAGGLRQDIDAGPLRIRDIVSALPFNNYLLVVDITGKELKELLANPETVVGGATFRFRDEPNGVRVVTSVVGQDGKAIADDQAIKLIINDFMYRGGDRYEFSDREPEETAVDWREPIFRLLRGLSAKGKTLAPPAGSRGTSDG